jgi:hypothetical protein
LGGGGGERERRKRRSDGIEILKEREGEREREKLRQRRRDEKKKVEKNQKDLSPSVLTRQARPELGVEQHTLDVPRALPRRAEGRGEAGGK